MSNSVLQNYITPSGFHKLRSELADLLKIERPKVVEVVSWAASNGDRSENGDYIYGKKRLREIDRRVHFLTKTLESARIIDPLDQIGNDQIFFGATVKFRRYSSKSSENEVKKYKEKVEQIVIVGKDETDFKLGRISWLSPVAKAVIKCRVGDQISINTPSGIQKLEILSVLYKKI